MLVPVQAENQLCRPYAQMLCMLLSAERDLTVNVQELLSAASSRALSNPVDNTTTASTLLLEFFNFFTEQQLCEQPAAP